MRDKRTPKSERATCHIVWRCDENFSAFGKSIRLNGVPCNGNNLRAKDLSRWTVAGCSSFLPQTKCNPVFLGIQKLYPQVQYSHLTKLRIATGLPAYCHVHFLG